jgi:hypothetical protein
LDTLVTEILNEYDKANIENSLLMDS